MHSRRSASLQTESACDTRLNSRKYGINTSQHWNKCEKNWRPKDKDTLISMPPSTKLKRFENSRFVFCDCLAAIDYFTRKPHENLYHFVLLKSTQFLWCSNKTRLRLITPGILEKKSSNSIHQPLGILEESSKSCCISHSANIPSGSLNFRNSCSLPTVMESNFR